MSHPERELPEDTYFNTDAEWEALAKEKEAKPNRVDRRLAMAELAVMTLPYANKIRSLFFGGAPRPKSKEKGGYPFTDVTHPLKNGGSVRNLGLRHSLGDLSIDQKHLAAAIDEADVVLLEGGQGDDEDYFSKLRNYAAKKGKTVYDIDNKRQFLMEMQNELSVGVPALIGAVGAVDDFKWGEKPEMQITRKGSRRNFLRGVAAASALAHLPVYIPDDGMKEYTPNQISYVVDGRTVKMLRHLREIIPEYPGKKILVMTGNTHALGIEYYNQHQDEFATKKAVYGVTYEPIYGLDKKKLTD